MFSLYRLVLFNIIKNLFSPCPKGTFNSMVGQTQCSVCPSNSTTASNGRNNQVDCYCNVGYYGRRGEPCKSCSLDPSEVVSISHVYTFTRLSFISLLHRNWNALKVECMNGQLEILLPGFWNDPQDPQPRRCLNSACVGGNFYGLCMHGYVNLEIFFFLPLKFVKFLFLFNFFYYYYII